MKKRIFPVVLLILNGCDGSLYPTISFEQIFKQEEKLYYVMFYLDSCMACRNIKLMLSKSQIRNIYYIDYSICNCDTENSDYQNIGIKSYEEIHVSVVPLIFTIYDYEVIQEIQGYANCRDWIIKI